jgi:TonB family protein
MKQLSFTLVFWSIIAIPSFAQHITYKTIYQDTINLRGIVLDAAGKPVGGVYLVSRDLTLYGKSRVYARTDSLGKFILIGAKLNDTILCNGPTGPTSVYNLGSRYMEIILPTLKTNLITASSPIVVSAHKKVLKNPLPVKIEIDDEATDQCSGCPIGHIEAMAEFPGGNDKFINYIKKMLVYPQQAIDYGIEGTVEITFSVKRDGTLDNFKVVKGLGFGCEDEVITILKNSKKWKPGMVDGRVLIYSESVSIQFKLNDK